MAYSNVHGTPVTDATLKGMTEYHDKAIQAVDRARVALEMKNAEGKYSDAVRSCDTTDHGVSCLIYNATGGPLKLVTAFHYLGWIEKLPYPPLLQNGQYASFVVGNTPGGCSVAVVYEDIQDPRRQWVLGWHRISNDTNKVWAHRSSNDARRISNGTNKCYAEIREQGYYSRGSPDSLRRSLQTLIDSWDNNNIHEVESSGKIIFSSIGNAPTPVYEATLTMKDAI